MSNQMQRGQRFDPLPNDVEVVRLGRRSFSSDPRQAHESDFALSTEDKRAEVPLLSVWATALTPATQAREFMGDAKANYRLALYLDTTAIRNIPDVELPRIDTVWDPDDRPGAEGHAGIVGLHRPEGRARDQYRRLRVHLARIARVEMLPPLDTT